MVESQVLSFYPSFHLPTDPMTTFQLADADLRDLLADTMTRFHPADLASR